MAGTFKTALQQPQFRGGGRLADVFKESARLAQAKGAVGKGSPLGAETGRGAAGLGSSRTSGASQLGSATVQDREERPRGSSGARTTLLGFSLNRGRNILGG